MPAGATFDPASGRFEWIPDVSQGGTYQVSFAATNSARQSATSQVVIEADAGVPVLALNQPFSCSPGAAARLAGKWLTNDGSFFSDPSGNSTDANGTKVKVNGEYATILSNSPGTVNFVCPALNPGTPLSVTVETAAATSAPLTGTMAEASPVILSVDGTGSKQGSILFIGAADIAMDRNYRGAAHPAQPGDQVQLTVSGLGRYADNATGNLAVKIGDTYADIQSVQPIEGYAGHFGIQLRVPNTATIGSAVPVQLEIATSTGRVTSNTVTAAVERVSR
jgi:uncharacterized protein (TIGR03437 family)